MQTWLVHMREPLVLLRDLGFPAFVTFQLIVGGNALSALIHPLFVGWFAFGLMTETANPAMNALFGSVVAVGYLTSALLSLAGLLRRGLTRHAWVLLLIPIHWLLLSTAAWRALYQLVRDPYRWEKTEHGLARTSRVREAATKNALAKILKQITEHAEPTYASADRPRRLPAAASG